MTAETITYINGDAYVRAPRAVADVLGDDLEAIIAGDIKAAITLRAQSQGTPVPADTHLEIAAMLVQMGMLTLTPEQIDMLVDIQCRGDRCDESALAIKLNTPVSQIKTRSRKAKKALEAASNGDDARRP